jgi:hypothetical protein
MFLHTSTVESKGGGVNYKILKHTRVYLYIAFNFMAQGSFACVSITYVGKLKRMLSGCIVTITMLVSLFYLEKVSNGVLNDCNCLRFYSQ